MIPPIPIAVVATIAAAAAPYTLDTGDRLRIIVFGEDEMTGEYNIGATGDIAFPLIGPVPARDRTPAEVEAAIRTRLVAGYIREPRVSVEVIEYRPFFILGEVTKPGRYPYAIGLTLDQAVATAGGYTYRAKTHRVFVKHKGDTAEARIDLHRGQSVPIAPGDTVRVAERFF